ncbi:MAG: hypothetical protein D6816_18480 [Bacteroidetes bacterium]|nr:MAG: hypothetical protein D6816_18480 [Bacteroidota bacterium]
MKFKGLLAVFFLGWMACQPSQEQLLCGKWQAFETLENGMPLKVDHSEIGFEFNDKGFYQFTSTLGYRESGRFSIKGDMLYTLDTVNKASSEKAVQIEMLTCDSLYLKMDANGSERIVKLYKVK